MGPAEAVPIPQTMKSPQSVLGGGSSTSFPSFSTFCPEYLWARLPPGKPLNGQSGFGPGGQAQKQILDAGLGKSRLNSEEHRGSPSPLRPREHIPRHGDDGNEVSLALVGDKPDAGDTFKLGKCLQEDLAAGFVWGRGHPG